MPVEFTQYLLPDGRSKRVSIDLGPEADNMANAVRDAGLRFEIEVLSTGEVSATLTCADADLAFDIGPNDETLPERMRALIKKSFDHLPEYTAEAAALASGD